MNATAALGWYMTQLEETVSALRHEAQEAQQTIDQLEETVSVLRHQVQEAEQEAERLRRENAEMLMMCLPRVST